MKKLFVILAAVCLVLCACASEPAQTSGNSLPPASVPTATLPEITRPTTPATEPATQPTETEATEPATQPTEPEPVGFPNPLTGELHAEPCVSRPYAVVMDNDEAESVPHWGASQADMIWELPHEGGTTRMVGVFSDVSDVNRLGPNRSVRPYILSVAQCFNAILVHAGGSPQGYELLESTDWDNLDGVQGSGAANYYHRDQDRLDAGIKSWHTMYTTGKEVLKYTAKLGYDTTFDEPADYGLTFAEDGTPDGGETAKTIKIRFNKSGKRTNLYYNAEMGKYTMEQFSQIYIDGNNGDVVTFENVLILKTGVDTIDDYGRLQVDMVGSGEGYFACGGKIVPIRWSRKSANSSYTYTLADGTPLTLGVGTTYIAVTHKNGTVTCA